MEKGLVRADSFTPVRQWLERDKIQTRTVRQRVNAKVKAITSGRWEIARPARELSPEELIERGFGQTAILCRETAAAIGLSWPLALEKLRVYEYTGRARRGYFVEGLSGAQFIKDEDYASVVPTLESPPDDTVWLTASDPAQAWGRLLAHKDDRGFMCVPGSAVALKAGVPVAVFERYGHTLRVFDYEVLQHTLRSFLRDYTGKRIFPEKKRLTVKQYPPEAAKALAEAGFTKVMMDYAAYH
jgi:ATP-dependent Lhr-like helicase